MKTLIAVALVVFLSTLAHAAPVTLKFRGAIHYSEIAGTDAKFSGSVTFDDAVPDLLADPSVGRYTSPSSSPYGFTFRSGTFSRKVTGSIYQLVQDHSTYACGTPCDGLWWLTASPSTDLLWLAFTSRTKDFVSTDGLVTDFSYRGTGASLDSAGAFFMDRETGALIGGGLTMVPEPSLLLMLGIGSVMLMKRRLT